MSSPRPEPTAEDRQALLGMIGGFSATQILYAAARVGVVDLVRSGQNNVATLAASLSLPPDRLGRFLRMLVVIGVLEEDGRAGFGVTRRGELLATDHPESLVDHILHVGEISYEVARHVTAAIATGRPAFDVQFGLPLFDYLASSPEARVRFDNLMADATRGRIEAILSAHDFRQAREVVDIGGGSGELILHIVRRHPTLRGLVFDLPGVVSDAAAHLAGQDVGSRIDLVAGDMFRDEPPRGADVYILSNVIHDWDDEQATAILARCRSAAESDSRILLVTELLPDRVADAPATIANDFSMLMLTGGRERTRAECERLLEDAGLRLHEVKPLDVRNGRQENWALLVARPA